MSIDIGSSIATTHNGRPVRGRIVGLEPSRQRRGFPDRGYVAVVRPHGEREPLEVFIPHDASGLTLCDQRS